MADFLLIKSHKDEVPTAQHIGFRIRSLVGIDLGEECTSG